MILFSFIHLYFHPSIPPPFIALISQAQHTGKDHHHVPYKLTNKRDEGLWALITEALTTRAQMPY